jgi:hypothetical protein
VIAEKVETMISRGDANTRERDYADVLVLSRVHSVEASRLRHALELTVTHRDTQLMPLAQAVETLPTDRQRDWSARASPKCPRVSEKLSKKCRSSWTPCSATIRTSSAGTPQQGSGKGDNEFTSVQQPGWYTPVRNGHQVPPHAPKTHR